VTTERQDELADTLVERVEGQADDLAVALVELADLLLDEEPLEDVLQRVAELAVAVVPGCQRAGVTLMDGDTPVTAAHTDELVLRVDVQQYEAGDGPCLDAVRNRRINRVSETRADERWPDFVEHARALGVRSFLAAPMLAGPRAVGALNLYSDGPDAFDALDDALVTLFCSQASVALTNARLYRQATVLNDQLQQAMASRAVIEQAKGIIMARYGLTADAAFDELRDRSQRANRKLRDVALDLVTGMPHQRS
jgi:GAF domain-containing protein